MAIHKERARAGARLYAQYTQAIVDISWLITTI
jgi:hypothetical protein